MTELLIENQGGGGLIANTCYVMSAWQQSEKEPPQWVRCRKLENLHVPEKKGWEGCPLGKLERDCH